MASSTAERSRRYRENQKKRGLYEMMKRKHRDQQRTARLNRTLAKKIADRRRDALRKRESRKVAVQQQVTTNHGNSSSAFKSGQNFGKAMKKAVKALPSNSQKKFELVKRSAEKSGIIKTSQQPRVARKLTGDTVDSVLTFYVRDDISWQAPGKRDTVTVQRNGKSETIQRRHLLFN